MIGCFSLCTRTSSNKGRPVGCKYELHRSALSTDGYRRPQSTLSCVCALRAGHQDHGLLLGDSLGERLRPVHARAHTFVFDKGFVKRPDVYDEMRDEIPTSTRRKRRFENVPENPGTLHASRNPYCCMSHTKTMHLERSRKIPKAFTQ